jgi:SAM-dependent methyltransferase
MSNVIRRVSKCRVCGSDNWFDVISFGYTTLANDFIDPAADEEPEATYPLEVVVCQDCWLMSLRHVVNPDVLFRHYVYVTSDSDLIGQHMRHIVEEGIRQAGLTHDDLVVELGSNVGTQLGLFQDAGYRVVGVDPARNLGAIANERGIPTISAFFGAEAAGQVRREHGPASFVLGRQCFAHIDDVHDVLDGVTTVLTPDGVLAIEVPYLANLLDESQFDTIFHEHLSYFSLSTLSRLFESHGLRTVGIERAPVHGGSIVVFASPAADGRPVSPAVADLLRQEEEWGLTSKQAFEDFAVHARRTIHSVRDLVRNLAEEGKLVAGYGAPSKGCALLEFCGLGPRDVRYIIDTTTMKQGKLTPGTHIPVQAPGRKAARPDYYLLLAWNYAPEIIRKEHSYLEGGGRIIVPIPEPRIVEARSPVAA